MDLREAAKKNIILKVRTGSHLFGTNTPESDLDMEGVYMPPPAIVYGLSTYRGMFKEVNLGVASKDETGRNTSDAVDYKIREYRHFAHLALQNNPNILNCLFANDQNVLYQNEYGENLRNHAYLFPNQGAYGRFMGYAHSQRMKMKVKPANHAALTAAEMILNGYDKAEILVNVARADESVFKDGGPGKHIGIGDIFLDRGIKVSRALTVIRNRLERVSARAVLWEKHGYDTKFASNLVQILMEGLDLVRTGRLKFPLEGAEEILAIKQGRFTIEEVHARSKGIEDEIRAAMQSTSLPKEPRFEEVDMLVQGDLCEWLGQFVIKRVNYF